jgi:leucyl-tRNA synthetase
MQDRYEPTVIEPKWQRTWETRGTFRLGRPSKRGKKYVLEMLPYPSGKMHMGHVRNYLLGDVYARYYRMLGFDVVHPMGWDAFGLPAENAAIKDGVHPAQRTRENIDSFKKEIVSLGYAYDWALEVDTSKPEYYRWNQWFFLKMLEKGLVYRRFSKVNWIGRSEGVECDFGLDGAADAIRVFTTRVDTIFGCTYVVLAPDHRLVSKITTPAQRAQVDAFVAKMAAKSKTERTDEAAEKEGVFTGAHAINPFNGAKVPVWIANFVLADYGTGAVMSVPAHDQRDFEFARKFGIPVRVVIQPEGGTLDGDRQEAAYDGPGRAVNSGQWTGLDSKDAIAAMTAHAEEKGFGKRTTSYRLKDWLISRQRYWGTPIPVVYCEKDGVVGVPDADLPVVLPREAPFTGEGGNPLEKVPAFVAATCPRCGGAARRETDTMDTFVDSSWYFYRYLSPHKKDGPFDGAAVRYWFPIDLYVGGIEHAILHLVYSRFWTKMMRDLGLVTFDEPVVRLFPQGMVHRDGEVMSKSKGNTVAPDDIISRYGADTLRLYILFVAPPEMALEWQDAQIEGPSGFLRRVWRLVDRHAERFAGEIRHRVPAELTPPAAALRRKVHQTIQRVTSDIEERLKLNTAVAALNELYNEVARVEADVAEGPMRPVLQEAIETLVLLLSPFAPHVCEEMWMRLGRRFSIVDRNWPVADPSVAREESVELPVQVNGKVRGHITVARGADEETLRRAALDEPRVKAHLDGKQVAKVVVVPDRMVSVVIR